jgi:hypothetical protein
MALVSNNLFEITGPGDVLVGFTASETEAD